MERNDFEAFYSKIMFPLANKFTKKYKSLLFNDNGDAIYEEYLNQNAVLHLLYEKKKENNNLLDRHKVSACMTVAILKCRPFCDKDVNNQGGADFSFANSSRINEQFAFMCAWELFKGFVKKSKEDTAEWMVYPETMHNNGFLDTITRSLFVSNQLNSLSTPLLANVFFLLEAYSKEKNNVE